MKRIVFSLVTILLNTLFLSAQSNSDFKEKELTIVYIAHTTDVPLARLTTLLEERYRGGVQFSNDVIFYLSNGSEPLIVKVNTPGENKVDFEPLIIDELWSKRSHDIDPYTDVATLIDIINKNDFIDENKELKYLSVTFDFFVGEEFWTMKYNESIIAKFYFTLDFSKIKQTNPDLFFNVYCPSEIELVYEDNKPFGLKDLDEINSNLMVLPY